MKQVFSILLSGFLVLTASVEAAKPKPVAVKPLTKIMLDVVLQEQSGVSVLKFPFTCEIGVPEGFLKSTDNARLLLPDGKTEISCVVSSAEKWKDKSIKTLLLDFQSDLAVRQKKILKLECGKGVKRKTFKSRLWVKEDKTSIKVDTGALTFAVSKIKFDFLSDLYVDLNRDGKYEEGSQILKKETGQEILLDAKSDSANADSAFFERYLASRDKSYSAVVESKNALSAVIKIEVKPRNKKDEYISSQILRLYVYNGKPYIKIVNTSVPAGEYLKYSASRLGLKLPTFHAGNKGYVFGTEDGGKWGWLSKGARAYIYTSTDNKTANYTLSLDKDSGTTVITTGKEAPGWVTLNGKWFSISAGVKDFKDLNPKELSIEEKDNSLNIYIEKKQNLKTGIEARSSEVPSSENEESFSEINEIFLVFHSPKEGASGILKALCRPPLINKGN